MTTADIENFNTSIEAERSSYWPNSPPVISSRPSSPIVSRTTASSIDTEQGDYMLVESPDNRSRYITSHRTPQASFSQPPRSSDFERCEALLIKQGKRIHALYELQKATNEKITWIQNELKKQSDRRKNIDLSEKVFGVSE
jgi:hypothetical protein